MKKNIFSVILASGVLVSGAALAAVYAYQKVKENEEEPEDGINEVYGDEEDEDEDEDEVVDLQAEPDEDAGNLEAFIIEHPEEKESLDAVKESFTADGVTTDIEVTGNTMFFDFIMEDVDDEDTKEMLKPDLASFLDEQSGAYAEVVASIEEETGIGDVKMVVIFMDANKEEIVSAHYDDQGKLL